MNKQMIEKIAEIAHGAVRALGIASGNVDIPTWQILPAAEKEVFRRGVGFAVAESCALAADPLTERLARMAYENNQRISEHAEECGWNGLSESKRAQWRLVVAVSRVFCMSSLAGGAYRSQRPDEDNTVAMPMAGVAA